MRGFFLLAGLTASCRGDLAPTADALELYGQGRGLLEAGQPLEAARAFEEAARLDPGSGTLLSWQAWALAQAGDLQGALDLLEHGLAPSMITPQVRYNRAAWMAGLGRHEQALAELERALKEDPQLRDSARRDSDFQPLVARGLLQPLLGSAPLRATLAGEEGSILLGERYDLQLELSMDPGVALSLVPPSPLPEGFALRKVIDDRSCEDDQCSRRLSYGLGAMRAGQGELGPWIVRAGARQAELPAVPWRVVAPPGLPVPEPWGQPEADAAYWTPWDTLGQLHAPDARTVAGRLLVLGEPGDRMELQASAGALGAAVLEPPLELELRQSDQVQLQVRAWAWKPGAEGVQVRVWRAGSLVLDHWAAVEP